MSDRKVTEPPPRPTSAPSTSRQSNNNNNLPQRMVSNSSSAPSYSSHSGNKSAASNERRRRPEITIISAQPMSTHPAFADGAKGGYIPPEAPPSYADAVKAAVPLDPMFTDPAIPDHISESHRIFPIHQNRSVTSLSSLNGNRSSASSSLSLTSEAPIPVTRSRNNFPLNQENTSQNIATIQNHSAPSNSQDLNPCSSQSQLQLSSFTETSASVLNSSTSYIRSNTSNTEDQPKPRPKLPAKPRALTQLHKQQNQSNNKVVEPVIEPSHFPNKISQRVNVQPDITKNPDSDDYNERKQKIISRLNHLKQKQQLQEQQFSSKDDIDMAADKKLTNEELLKLYSTDNSTQEIVSNASESENPQESNIPKSPNIAKRRLPPPPRPSTTPKLTKPSSNNPDENSDYFSINLNNKDEPITEHVLTPEDLLFLDTYESLPPQETNIDLSSNANNIDLLGLDPLNDPAYASVGAMKQPQALLDETRESESTGADSNLLNVGSEEDFGYSSINKNSLSPNKSYNKTDAENFSMKQDKNSGSFEESSQNHLEENISQLNIVSGAKPNEPKPHLPTTSNEPVPAPRRKKENLDNNIEDVYAVVKKVKKPTENSERTINESNCTKNENNKPSYPPPVPHSRPPLSDYDGVFSSGSDNDQHVMDDQKVPQKKERHKILPKEDEPKSSRTSSAKSTKPVPCRPAPPPLPANPPPVPSTHPSGPKDSAVVFTRQNPEKHKSTRHSSTTEDVTVVLRKDNNTEKKPRSKSFKFHRKSLGIFSLGQKKETDGNSSSSSSNSVSNDKKKSPSISRRKSDNRNASIAPKIQPAARRKSDIPNRPPRPKNLPPPTRKTSHTEVDNSPATSPNIAVKNTAPPRPSRPAPPKPNPAKTSLQKHSNNNNSCENLNAITPVPRPRAKSTNMKINAKPTASKKTPVASRKPPPRPKSMFAATVPEKHSTETQTRPPPPNRQAPVRNHNLKPVVFETAMAMKSQETQTVRFTLPDEDFEKIVDGHEITDKSLCVKTTDDLDGYLKTARNIEIHKPEKVSDIVKACALFDFIATETDDLNFVKGDVILILEDVNDDWYRGQLNGKVGLFPKAYVSEVKKKPERPKQQPKKNSPEKDLISMLHSKNPKLNYDPTSPDWGDENKEPAIIFNKWDDLSNDEELENAQPEKSWEVTELDQTNDKNIQNYTENKENDLEEKKPIVFEENRRSIPEEKVDLNLKVNAVDVKDSASTDDLANSDSDEAKEEFYDCENTDLEDHNINHITTIAVQNDKAKMSVAIFSFEGENDNELSFQPGNMIKILDEVNSDWLKGEFRGKTGIFPAAYVQQIIPP